MRAQNHKEINAVYWKFSGYLVACIFTGIFVFFCYIRTSDAEVDQIVSKTEEYDNIYIRQIDLVSRIDSLYHYAGMINTELRDIPLLNSVAKQRQEIISMMEGMNSKDIRIYQKLMTDVNLFLGVKDSIRIAKIDENMVKTDLQRCTDDSRRASRRTTVR